MDRRSTDSNAPCVGPWEREPPGTRRRSSARVKPWLKEGVAWRLGDAPDSRLVEELGAADFAVANNFLCHMDVPAAERCLRNLARLVKPDSYLFVSGVDLNVRTKVGWILAGSPWWSFWPRSTTATPWCSLAGPANGGGLEPLDRKRPDWQTRYASVFRVREAPR